MAHLKKWSRSGSEGTNTMKRTKRSKFGKLAIVAAALVVLLASAAAQSDWPYPDLNAVGYDSADTFGHFTNGGTYNPGATVTIKATAKSDYEDAVNIDIYSPYRDIIASHNFGSIPGTTDEFDFALSPTAEEGLYEIRANGIHTDSFTVEGAAIPEFTTIAIPVTLLLLTMYGFTRRKKAS